MVLLFEHLEGWTAGNEKGAANYIHNLVSQNNGPFIEVWEADALKHLFGRCAISSAPAPAPARPRRGEDA
jgi:hypothetical protein